MRARLIILFNLLLSNICFSQWVDISTGINGGNPSFINSNGTYLFTSAYNKIYRSSNNGDNWQLLNTQHLNIRSFWGFESINNNIFLLVTNNDSIVCYKSINNGETWTLANQGLLNTNARNLMKSGNTLFVYPTTGATIYRSTNLGNSWQSITLDNLFEIYCAGANSSAILAAVGLNLMRSINNGDNWTTIDNASPPFVIMTANENYFFGRRLNGHNYYSSNQGTNWIQMPDALVGSFSKLYIFGNLFYAITDSGIVRSTNLGQSWINLNNITKNATNIIVANNTLFSTNVYRGIYSTNVNNINWVEKNNGIQAENLSEITSDNNDNLYAVQKYGSCIYITETKLNQWTKKYPSVEGRLLTIHGASNDVYLGAEGGLYKSIDEGNNWNLIPFFTNKYVSNIISSGDSIYTAVLQEGIYFSSNAGASWQLRNNGITSFFPTFNDLKKIGNNLFMVEQMYAFRSTDCGLNWTRMTDDFQGSIQRILGISGSNIFVSNGTYAYKSINNGVNWTNTFIPVKNMLVKGDSIIMACTSQYPIKLSTNNLTNYKDISRELENKAINYIYNHKNIIYAAVAGYGIYKHTFGSFVNITNSNNVTPVRFALHQNYPNPFNPATKIKFEIPGQSYVILKIYNLLGQEITTLVNQNLGIGNHELEWNAENFNSGIYFYRFEILQENKSTYIETKKMLFIK